MKQDCNHFWTIRESIGAPSQMCNACGETRPFPKHRPSKLVNMREGLPGSKLYVCTECRRPVNHELHDMSEVTK